MINLQLYKNPETYPNYAKTITPVGNALVVTPVNIDSRRGAILVQLDFNELHKVNYLRLDFGATYIYGFITNIEHHSGDKRYLINYEVDAFRTYINKATLGNQFIKRSPASSNTIDPLLRADNGLTVQEVQTLRIGSAGTDRMLAVVLTAEENQYTDYPIQPSPYITFFRPYSSQNWTADPQLTALIAELTKSEKPLNLVSIYSIPHFQINLSQVIDSTITLKFADDRTASFTGFWFLGAGYMNANKEISNFAVIPKPSASLRRAPHSFTLIVPDAGLINIPSDVMFSERPLHLIQDIDISTGASNYQLAYALAGEYDYLPYSMRGQGVSGLPLAYNPEQQLLSINQTNRLTGLIGDVAGVALGGVQVLGGILAAPATGGLSLGMAGAGAIQAGSSLLDAFTRDEALKDSLHTHTNPSSFLGNALLTRHRNNFYLVTQYTPQENASLVHSLYGYPQNKLGALVLPTDGFIQTQECAISGADIPDWAKQEINQQFNRGIRVK